MNVQVKILEVSGIETAFAYVGLPMGKIVDPARTHEKRFPDQVWVDLEKVITKLIGLGDEHAKIMRQVTAHMEITAPRYWWQQFATYRAGVEMYSGSTMHTLLRDEIEQGRSFTPETEYSPALARALRTHDIVKGKANLPEGYLQTRLVMVSYQTLRRMWLQRRKHRLPEWHEFIEALHELPYSEDLIFVEPYNPWREAWVEWFDSSGDPCEEIYPGGPLERTCFFCGNQRGHCPNCVYPKVKRLLDKETE